MTAVLFPARTAFTSRTLKAERPTKQAVEIGSPATGFAVFPEHTWLSLRTSSDHLVPINEEVGLVVGSWSTGLPTGIISGRTQQVNPLCLAAEQVIWIDIAGIYPMRLRG